MPSPTEYFSYVYNLLRLFLLIADLFVFEEFFKDLLMLFLNYNQFTP